MTKRTQEEIDAWLNDLYLECIQKKTPHSLREFEVISRIDDFLRIWSKNNIPEKDYAIRWIRDRCKQGADNLPISIFAFYYDTEFWEVKIFEVYGSVNIDPRMSLTDMPYALITYLSNNFSDIELYESHWANCFDLEYGLREIPKALYETNSFATELLLSGAQNLNAATAALLYTNHNNQVMMSIRMALEMFIKSYIAFHDHSKKTDKEKNDHARNEIKHNLKKGLEQIKELSPDIINPQFFKTLEIFPKDIGKQRYIPENMAIQDIAQCYDLTLKIGAMVTRSITDRNILNQ